MFLCAVNKSERTVGRAGCGQGRRCGSRSRAWTGRVEWSSALGAGKAGTGLGCWLGLLPGSWPHWRKEKE